MSENLRNGLRQRLVELGWTGEAYTAIARKEYETAVGLKTALVYLADFGPSEETLMLTGDYQSEGRNALSTTMVSVPRLADESSLRLLAEKFAIAADAAVADTYAAKLHRPANAA